MNNKLTHCKSFGIMAQMTVKLADDIFFQRWNMLNVSPNKNTRVTVDCANDNGPFVLFQLGIYSVQVVIQVVRCVLYTGLEHKHKYMNNKHTYASLVRLTCAKERKRDESHAIPNQRKNWDNQ